MATESPELYLIAHKVRGELAWDVAHKLQIGDEEGWLIPTSGHRAYPLTHWKLDDLVDVDDYPHKYPAQYDPKEPMWGAVPDHYETTADKGRGVMSGLTALLGIRKPTLDIKRRI